ncbi:MAG: aconitase X catalytic domain-containing protein [Candidatus Anstonellales archaeon]
MVELTKREQKMLDGEFGEATQEAMEILVALAKIYDAKNMIPVSSAQIAGVSYATIGDAGLEYLKEFARKGAKVRIPAFLNPAGMDLEQWKEMRVPEEFAKKQIEIMNAYINMGVHPTATCTPYLIGIRPKRGEHVAWSESSAVVFANSVLGARTNREGGPSALAAAMCGVTPNYGLHLDENRFCSLLVEVEAKLEKISDFGALGYHVGALAKGKNPAFFGIKKATEDQLKSLGAAMAASGSVALYNMKNITPEYRVIDRPEKITITEREIKETKEKLSETKKVELMTFGCPHASIEEIKEIAEKIKGKKLKCELWICTARKTKEKADRLGLTKIIQKAGGRIVADTCMVVSPLYEMGYRKTSTNSGKSAKYLRDLCRQKVFFGELEEMVCE